MASDGASGGVAPSLGSYKGVMLCNRPLGQATSVRSLPPGEAPFKVGISTEPVHPSGKNITLARALEKMPPVEREDTVLDKHRRWLKELETQKTALLAAAEDAKRRREEKRTKFMDAQKAFRELVRSQPVGSGTVTPTSPRATAASGSVPTSPRAGAPSLAEATAHAARVMAAAAGGKDTKPNASSSSTAQGVAGSEHDRVALQDEAATRAAAKGKQKPAWARTEAAHAAAEDAEAEALVKFADSLDYDRYVEHLDSKTEDDFLSKQLRELEVAEKERKDEIEKLEAAMAKQKEREERRRRREERAAKAAAEGVIEGAPANEDEQPKKRRKGKKKSRKHRSDRPDAAEGAALMAHLIAGAAPLDAAGARQEAAEEPTPAGQPGGAANNAVQGSSASAPDASASSKPDARKAGADSGRDRTREPGPRFLVGGVSHRRRRRRGDDSSTSSSSSSSDDEEEDGDEEGGSDSVDVGEDSDMETLDTVGSLRVPAHVRIRVDDDASSIATSVLSSASSLRGVHSKRSLAAVIDRHMREQAAHTAAALAAGVTEEAVQPPRIVVVPDNPPAGAVAQKKALISQLPYQHRHPAV